MTTKFSPEQTSQIALINKNIVATNRSLVQFPIPGTGLSLTFIDHPASRHFISQAYLAGSTPVGFSTDIAIEMARRLQGESRVVYGADGARVYWLNTGEGLHQEPETTIQDVLSIDKNKHPKMYQEALSRYYSQHPTVLIIQ